MYQRSQKTQPSKTELKQVEQSERSEQRSDRLVVIIVTSLQIYMIHKYPRPLLWQMMDTESRCGTYQVCLTTLKTGMTVKVEGIDSLIDILYENPNKTFKCVNDLYLPCYKDNDKLSKWLENKQGNLELVFNECILWNMKDIRCIDTARYIVEWDYWSGDCSIFSKNLMSDYDFCAMIVKSDKWNGFVCEVKKKRKLNLFFSESVMKNPDFFHLVIQSSSWNGDLLPFSFFHYNDYTLYYKVVASANWNGSCSTKIHTRYFHHIPYELRNDIKFCKLVLNSSKWNGCSKFVGIDVLRNFEMCYTLIRDLRWIGDISSFPPNILSSELFVIDMLHSTKDLMGYKKIWDGSCQYFPSNIMKNKTICSKIIESPLWDGDKKYFDCEVKHQHQYEYEFEFEYE